MGKLGVILPLTVELKQSLNNNKRAKKGLSFLLLAGFSLSQTHGAFAQEGPDNQELARRLDLLAERLEEVEVRESGGVLEGQHGFGPEASQVYSAGVGLSIGGYGEMVGAFRPASQGADSVDMLRAVTYIGYRFDEQWVFNSEIEVEHGNEIGVEFAYLDWDGGRGLGFRAGHLLVPMGWANELHEPTIIRSVNRPEIERFVLPSTWHENGAGAWGEQEDFSWRAYVLTGFDAAAFGDLASTGLRSGRQNGSEAGADNLALTARADWHAIPGLTLGASFWSGDSNQDPTSNVSADTSIQEVHGRWLRGPLELKGLWVQAEVDGAIAHGSTSEELNGWYLEAAWDLFAGRGQDSLSPFIRVGGMDLAADSLADTDQKILVGGVGWQPRDELIFKLNGKHTSSATGDTLTWEIGLGWIF